jgi:tRNA(Ile)-lysidine synthase
VLHFNHQLRGAESDADESFVAGLAAQRGLDFHSGRADVAAAARRGVNLEEAARQHRYAFLEDAVATGRATRVAVGHTADDQAETVLAHILRGTGLAGLAAIHPLAGCIVRPLLDVRRSELRNYLTARGQAWREDVTNRDTLRLRARIRERLLPLLETEFQPEAVSHLTGLAARAREEEAFWAALVEDRFVALVSKKEEGWEVRVAGLLHPFPAFEAGGSALARRLVRRLYAAAKGDRRQLTAAHVEQVLRLATESTSGHRVPLPGGVEVERSFDRLLFRRLPPGNSRRAASHDGSLRAFEVAVVTEGEHWPLSTGHCPLSFSVPAIQRRFELKVIDWPPATSETSILAGALDADLVRPPLILRSWRPGDAYRPRGCRRVHKLKKLLLERRVAVRDRPGWPVLTSGGRVVWARAMPPAEEFAARAGTRAGLLIFEETL